MSNIEHSYDVHVKWTGNLGQGTNSYKAYARDHEIEAKGKPVVLGSSDPKFRGNPSRYNPEELLIASLSACHMLWYLHLCAAAGIVVIEYVDHASGTMIETSNGGAHFKEVTLKPTATIKEGSDREVASELHERSHQLCFIANSVNFPVYCSPRIVLSRGVVAKS